MPLQKQNLAIPFSTALDLKTDPLQVMPTSMLVLENAIYLKDKRLQKRNGYEVLTSLPEGTSATTLSTFDGNLIAIGNRLQAYSNTSNEWIDHGRYQPVKLSVQPMVRSSLGQVELDVAVAPNGLACTGYTNSDGSAAYQISNSTSSQVLEGPVSLPSGAKCVRVFVLGNYFVVTFLITITATAHLQFVAIPVGNITNPSAVMNVSSQVKSDTTGYDGVIVNSTLYLAWNASDGGGAIRAVNYDSNLNAHAATAIAGQNADLLTISADNSTSTPIIYITYYSSSGTTLKTLARDHNLLPVLAPTTLDTSDTIRTLTALADNGVNVVYFDVIHTPTHAPVPFDLIKTVSCTQTGTVSAITIVSREVGLGSKAFVFNGTTYFLAAYLGVYQPTYFLMDSTRAVIGRLAYSNGGGYPTTQVLPSVSIEGNIALIGYQIKDLIQPVNKDINAPSQDAIYSQTGVNLASFDLSSMNVVTAEIGNDLYIAGGMLWMYDGETTSEQGFNLWPDYVFIATSASGGLLTAQDYFYQVTYEWTDAQGNIHRSAPSIPVEVTTTGSTSSNTLTIPTLRLTYKTEVRIVIYRWSTGQESFYQITSVTNPLLNDPTVDEITYVDTLADSSIIGNLLIYTTGGVVEDIPGPPCSTLGLYKARLMLVDSEDPNTLWYSKQVIEGTPVEMSDLFTEFISPSFGAQGSTGPTTALSAMDDKFILYKPNAIYYITGNGPDNTGANNDFSDPIFITATVGCDNQQSICFIPSGLVSQSDKGIWLLGRDLSTRYIGDRVENFNSDNVNASVGVPGTNQIRMMLDESQTLMYDYYFDRWGTFTNPSGISNTLFQGLHTYLDKFGRVLQETPGLYQDAGSPVLIGFTTAWMNLLGLQGFERAYQVYLLGQFLTPNKIQVNISFDYALGPLQSVLIQPNNYDSTWGDPNGPSPYWGQDTFWGGEGNLEQFRIFLSKQKCQAFQIAVQELYDPTFQTTPGQGLVFNGLNLVVGAKKGYVPLPATQSVG